MPKNQDSLNNELFDLLQSRGYNPVMLNTAGKEIPVPDEADVFQFHFEKDGEDYGTATVSIDGLHKLVIYFGDKIASSPKLDTNDSESWYHLLRQIRRFAQKHQLSFETRNIDKLEYDMAKREHTKKLDEGYYSAGKKASISDNTPTVKMRIQHTREIQEGEQRFRNIARIFVENNEGERFLIPTNKPGLARVFARHIAEGGTPYDDRGQHIGKIVEEYQHMAGFVRATRNGQFNESAQKLVNEGINHYQKLRESLHKMAGKRGYNEYFENWSAPLMEDEEQVDLSEMFMSSSLDPRIENVMPILSKLSKNITETAELSEVKELEEWADSISEGDVIEAKVDFASKFKKKIDKHNTAVVKTNKKIGTRVADIGAGGKEHNVTTDKAWDDQKSVKEGSGDPEITPGMKTQYGTVVKVNGNTVIVKASNGELTKVNIHDIDQGMAEGQLDEIGDTPAGQAALQRYGNKAHNQVAAHWKQVHNKSHLPTDKKMAKRNAGTVAAGNRIHGFGIDKNQQDKVTGRFKYRDAVGLSHVYQKNNPLEQGVAKGADATAIWNQYGHYSKEDLMQEFPNLSPKDAQTIVNYAEYGWTNVPNRQEYRDEVVKRVQQAMSGQPDVTEGKKDDDLIGGRYTQDEWDLMLNRLKQLAHKQEAEKKAKQIPPKPEQKTDESIGGPQQAAGQLDATSKVTVGGKILGEPSKSQQGLRGKLVGGTTESVDTELSKIRKLSGL